MIGFRRAKTEKGFTLIEIIASLAIIGLGLVGILSLFPVGIDASKRAGDLTNATVLAQGVLNQMRAAAKTGNLTLNDAKTLFETAGLRNFKDFDRNLSNEIIPIEDSQIPKVRVGGQDNTLYQYQVKFEEPPGNQDLDDLDGVGLQQVTIIVSWPATERQLEFRNRATFVTFVRFPQ